MTWRTKRTFATFLLLGLATLKCSNPAFDGIVAADAKSGSKAEKSGDGDKSKPKDETPPPSGAGDKSTKPDDGGVDDPIWINGSFLTCTWDDAGAKDSVAALCGVTTASALDAATLHWDVVDLKGIVLDDNPKITPGADGKVKIVMSGVDFTKMGVQATVSADAISARASFRKLLPGLKDTDSLTLCFTEGVSPSTCMKAAGAGEAASSKNGPQATASTGRLPQKQPAVSGSFGTSFADGASSTNNSSQSCQYGMQWNDSCWRRSEPGESCELTCSTHGGNDGGTVSMQTNLCQLISGFLGDGEKPWGGDYADCSKGVGCYADAQKRYMCTNGNITLQATTRTRRFCSCVR